MDGLPVVMRANTHRLKSFTMTSRCFPAGQNGGMWLWRHYYSSMGTWLTYQRLENLTIDAWFFFEGQSSFPHPNILSTQLPDSIKTLYVRNLVGDYLRQFYEFCRCVVAEKQADMLGALETTRFSTLVANAAFPPPGSPMDLAQLTADLLAEGVVLA